MRVETRGEPLIVVHLTIPEASAVLQQLQVVTPFSETTAVVHIREGLMIELGLESEISSDPRA